MPTTHWPGMVSTTAAGPALHFSVPRLSSVAVGSVRDGPTPQITGPALAGEK